MPSEPAAAEQIPFDVSEQEVDEALTACDGDPSATIRALLVGQAFLEHEIAGLRGGRFDWIPPAATDRRRRAVIQRTKRFWSSMDTTAALNLIADARRRVAAMMGKAPIGSDAYRALSALMEDLARAARAFGHDVTRPAPAKSLSVANAAASNVKDGAGNDENSL